jgi:acyl-CoA reductase-like NAD-dependent aldehyde dehydrogenase
MSRMSELATAGADAEAAARAFAARRHGVVIAGGFGKSGLGRELGAHGLAAYTEPKSLFVSV